MNIHSFFSYLKSYNGEQGDNKVIYIKSHLYPVLFFSVCKKILHGKGIHIQTCDVQTSEALWMAHLEMSFLAMQCVYWLVAVDQLDEKKRINIINYCTAYRGPHTLIVCINDTYTLPDDVGVIALDMVDASAFNALADVLYPAPIKKRNMHLGTHIFKRKKTISFDSALVLMHYSVVLGSSVETFVHTWLDELLEPEKSLFIVSAAFFARKGDIFFGLWHRIKDDYAPAFWTMYWSEQLVRAYFYVRYMQERNIVEAKKVAYRLPFSFIQKDWQSITLPALQKSHDFLYTLDYKSKNSVGMYGFELMFAQFFNVL